MRINAEKAALLVIDVQSRLIPHMYQSEELLDKVCWLCNLVQCLKIPTVVSEHCVDKIGATTQIITKAADNAQFFGKRSFSAVRDGITKRSVLKDKTHIIVCGIESHVCVMQTCLDLIAEGKTVYLVRDAVSSRQLSNIELAVARLRQAGAIVLSAEMVAFELLATADHPDFSTVLKTLIK